MDDPTGGTALEDVTVVHDGIPVLRDVTLRAADGELLVVLGPSGSGKSTLLRALAGLDPVGSGTVRINGRDVTGTPTAERRVAMVFETSALIPFLDVSRNLGWGLRLQRMPEAEVEDRVEDRARRLRLSRLLPRRPDKLSTGERGLVGIGHALVQRPEVFLLDEPLAGLDAGERIRVRQEIVGIVRSLGVTTFFVTHDQAEGLAVADRVALLDGGVVVQVGAPRDLYERPANLFVAGFVGAPPIGLLAARLVSAGGQGAFAVGDRMLPLWSAVPPPLLDHVGREVVLGVRAEDVHDPAAGQDPDAVSLEAVVRDVEYTGPRTVVTVVVDAPPVTAPGSPSVDGSRGAVLRWFAPPRSAFRPGDAVTIAIRASSAHVFDAVTGRALRHPDTGPPDVS